MGAYSFLNVPDDEQSTELTNLPSLRFAHGTIAASIQRKQPLVQWQLDPKERRQAPARFRG
jgi:hypothetical protein